MPDKLVHLADAVNSMPTHQRVGIDLAAFASIAAAFAELMNPILTMIATTLSITWLLIQLFRFFYKLMKVRK